jgi:hypothetical protein
LSQIFVVRTGTFCITQLDFGNHHEQSLKQFSEFSHTSHIQFQHIAQQSSGQVSGVSHSSHIQFQQLFVFDIIN